MTYNRFCKAVPKIQWRNIFQIKKERDKMEFEIIHLPKEQWKDTILPIGYTTEAYYDVTVSTKQSGFSVSMEKKRFEKPVTHTPQEYDFPDKLYADWWEGACAWGVLAEGRLIAAIETDPEIWSNRLRVTELWVDAEYQKQGIGHALMEVAKEQAKLERRRAIILETQSCNVNAIDFYLHEGFTLIGMDTCCYANNDLERKEVRIEMGWFVGRKPKLSRNDIEIRMEQPGDYQAVERMTQEAFWNRYQKGCDEHYLVHKLRSHKDYLPELSRIAVKDGEIIGAIMYSKAIVRDREKCYDILNFGPLCVKPGWYGCGVGELLVSETKKLAAKAGYPGIIIFGEPDYYPRLGFTTCDHFGITTADGKNFDAFMGIELVPGGMKGISGRFYESEAFESLSAKEAEAYNGKFPPLKKQYFPAQWK